MAKNGEMLDIMRRLGSFDDDVTRFYAAEIVVALEHLHSLGIIHRSASFVFIIYMVYCTPLLYKTIPFVYYINHSLCLLYKSPPLSLIWKYDIKSQWRLTSRILNYENNYFPFGSKLYWEQKLTSTSFLLLWPVWIVPTATYFCWNVISSEKTWWLIFSDLKPENILLDEKMHILISDFGSAKVVDPAAISIVEGGLAWTFSFVSNIGRLYSYNDVCKFQTHYLGKIAITHRDRKSVV